MYTLISVLLNFLALSHSSAPQRPAPGVYYSMNCIRSKCAEQFTSCNTELDFGVDESNDRYGSPRTRTIKEEKFSKMDPYGDEVWVSSGGRYAHFPRTSQCNTMLQCLLNMEQHDSSHADVSICTEGLLDTPSSIEVEFNTCAEQSKCIEKVTAPEKSSAATHTKRSSISLLLQDALEFAKNSGGGLLVSHMSVHCLKQNCQVELSTCDHMTRCKVFEGAATFCPISFK